MTPSPRALKIAQALFLCEDKYHTDECRQVSDDGFACELMARALDAERAACAEIAESFVDPFPVSGRVVASGTAQTISRRIRALADEVEP